MALPETDGPMREWLRSFSTITTITAQRQYFGEPPKVDEPELPFIVFYRVGGIPDTHQQDYPDYVFECWGANKFLAASLATVLAGLIQDSNEKPPVITTGGKVMAGLVNSGPVQMGSVARAKRYRIDASFHIRS